MSDTVQQIKDRLDIVEVVSQYVELKKAGKHFKGKSPFTSEKTPSFFVSPDRGMYYCFSSNQGGDMFTFIQTMEGIDFKGALALLAEKAGVEITSEDPKKRDERDRYYSLLEAATEYFFENATKHEAVNAYLSSRGVRGKTIHAWRIGYANDDWRTLRAHMTDAGYTDRDMLAAGLIKRSESGKEPYDVFRDRIVFPICDPAGRPIAFSGRILHPRDEVPKYVNSPETAYYQKSEVLFGFDKAKQGIRRLNFSLIVEGQFDVVLAHQAGYDNAVAVSGTALTPHHVGLLQRLSDNVVLALDADRAGIEAMKKGATLMLDRGMDVKIAVLPEGTDPADMIAKDGGRFKQVIGESVHVIEFLLSHLQRVSRDERAYKIRVREELLPIVGAIPSSIDRDHFEGVVAASLGSSKESIHAEVARIIEAESQSARSAQAAPDTVPKELTPAQRSRYVSLREYLYAIAPVFAGSEHAQLETDIRTEVRNIVTKKEYEALEATPSGELSKIQFEFEAYIETIPARQLYTELSEKLTELKHLHARFVLTKLRREISDAESSGEHDRAAKLLEKTKTAYRELQEQVTLSVSESAQQG